jgi:hypothetical protein
MGRLIGLVRGPSATNDAFARAGLHRYIGKSHRIAADEHDVPALIGAGCIPATPAIGEALATKALKAIHKGAVPSALRKFSVGPTPARLINKFQKASGAQQIVSGLLLSETPGSDGSVADYATSAPLFRAWSESIRKATDDKSFGNVRGSGSTVAAGKLVKLHFDDARRQITAEAHIVDRGEWAKVASGTYLGFEVNGRFAKRWKGDDGVMRYALDPTEVVLSDMVSSPDMAFELIKRG